MTVYLRYFLGKEPSEGYPAATTLFLLIYRPSSDIIITMKYLFFDAECANCFNGTGKIYSLGYVECDENLNIISSADIVLNPRARFDWYVKKHMLSYDVDYILSRPDFRDAFKDIRALFDGAVAVGYDTERDVAYLNHEFLRYRTEPFDIDYVDVKAFIKELTGEDARKLSVEYANWCLHPSEKDHNSNSDALHTLEITRAICSKTDKSLADLIAAYPSASGRSHDFKYGFSTDKVKKDVKRAIREKALKDKKKLAARKRAAKGPKAPRESD